MNRLFATIFLFYFFIKSSHVSGQVDKVLLNPVNHPLLTKYDLRMVDVDKKGNLWLATDKGVVKFDGNDISVFDNKKGDTNSLSINSQGRFFFDRQDNLYTIGVGAVIDFLNTKTGQASKLKINLRKEDLSKFEFPYAFSRMYVDHDGSIWVGMYYIGFIHFDPKNNKTTYYDLSKRHDFQRKNVFDIKGDPKNSEILWIATDDGIYSFDKKTQKLARSFRSSHPKDSIFYDLIVRNMEIISNDTIWFAVPYFGFGCYDTKTGLYTMFPDKDKKTGKVIYHSIDMVQRKSDHELYMSSGGGLPGIFNTRDHSYTYNTRLNQDYPSVSLAWFLRDSVGLTWALPFGQLYKAERNKKTFKTVLLPDSSSPNNVPNVFKITLWDEKSQVFYAVFSGRRDLVVLDRRMKEIKTIPIEPAHPVNITAEPNIFDAVFDKEGRLWLCGSALWIFDNYSRKFKVINGNVQTDLRKLSIQNMICRGDYIYLQPGSASFNAIYRINTSTFHCDSIPLPKEITSDTTRMNQLGKKMDILEMDDKGQYAYVCYNLSLFQFNLENGKVKKIRTLLPAVKAFPHFYNMFWYQLDGNGNLWVTTMEGIKIYNPVSLEVIREIPAEKDSYPLNLFHVDNEKVMCLLYSNGVVLFDYNKNKEFKLSLSDGLTTIFNSGINVSNNTLFVGAFDYFHHASFPEIINNSNQRRCYLSKITLFNKDFQTDTLPEYLHHLTLPYNKNSISLTFSSTEFDQPERLEYQYKLTGIDKDWVPANYLNRTIFYNNLEPGEYTFLVTIKNPDGSWSKDGVNLAVIIIPAWWQTTWFKIVTFLAASFLLFWLVRWRIRTVRKQEQQKLIHEKELLELEAKALRAQMNPHFIFNCLNSIKALMQEKETDKGIIYLTTFSKLIRTLFQNSDKTQIGLYDEIETCRLYTQLEAMRLNGKLKYSFHIDPNIDLKSIRVPALIIQPFIENAIWHGIVPKEQGTLNIIVQQNGDAITCEIDDDGIGREMSKLNKPITQVHHESKGVNLSQARLNLEKMLNETNASIEVIDKYENGTATGTRIILKIILTE